MSNPERRLTKIEIPTLISEKDAFRERIVGQDEAVEAFATLLAKLRSGIRQQRPGPSDIKFLAGPSGVGKTEMVYTLAELLAEGEDNPRAKVIKLNGGEYQEDHMIARLVGSPPGYRGSEDPHYPDFKNPALFSQENLDQNRIVYTDRTGQQRSAVFILVDEAEKASDALHRAFLGVLDKGQMTIGNNKSSDFSNAVIFYTSNVGNQEVEQMRLGTSQNQQVAREVISDSFRNAFPPEFRGRIRELIVFNSLNEEAIRRIASIKIKRVEQDFGDNGIRISLELSPAALEWVITQGYNPSEGVRALEKVIERSVHDRLVLAHVGIDIHRKRIYADIENGDVELSFYFNEGEQLPDFPSQPRAVTQPARAQEILPQPVIQKPVEHTSISSPAAQATQQKPSIAQPAAQRPEITLAQRHSTQPQKQQIPAIPDRFKQELLKELEGSGVVYYVRKRDELAKTGAMDPQSANLQQEIKIAAANRALKKLVEEGVRYYVSERDQIDRAGIITTERLNNQRLIKEAAEKRLRDKLQYGTDSFINERNQLVKAGIGTEEEWNKILFESS